MSLSAIEYRLLIEHSPVMIWRANLTKECDYFNAVWLDFTGRTLEQESGNGWAEGVHPDDFNRCLEIYVSSFDLRLPFEMEYRLKRYDGVYRWIFDRGVPYTDDRGEFMGYIGSCVDVHERVEAQRAQAAAQRAELNLLRGMLSICSECKRIRTPDGWEQVESYVRKRSKADFTQTFCPACLSRVSPLGR
ncbi:MAG TPA: PAS domain-containing protein [Longimicrobiales bacterium]|nr:PAS domain-containing protein [Longimicrobiales bacterium]